MSKISRRNFLYWTAGLSATIGFDSLLLPKKAQSLPSIAPSDRPEIINLVIQKTDLNIGDRPTQAITINGTLPGQLIRLKEGTTATINVTNHLDEDTSIHWHGIILPPSVDGVPAISFAGIKPHQTYTYQFPVNQNGTYWYHSHSGLQEQQGHFGALIIDPSEPEPFTYAKDYVILLSDWSFEDPHQIIANLKKNPAFYNNQRRTLNTMGEDWEWRGMRMDPSDIADVTGATYSYLMNGKTGDENWTALFKQGEKIRLRFINASAMTFFDVRIPGLEMTVVQADGQNIQPVTVDEFRIGTAETYDVIVAPKTQDAYTIFAETIDRSGFARGTLAIAAGLAAEIPPRRERPLRTMDDMGMDHSSMNHSQMNHEEMTNMDHSSMNNEEMMNMDHSSMNNEEMMNMDHSSMNHQEMTTMDHSSMNHEAMMNMDHAQMTPQNTLDTTPVPHSLDTHGIANAAIPMMVKNRLGEPGIGLENETHRVLVYTDLKSLKINGDRRQPDREIELHLTGNMERYMWSFDGKKYSEQKEIIFNYGERLRLTMVNDTMMEHPIHLHGMWMELDNGAGDYKPRKHTIIVKPAEKLSTEINVDALGRWAFHCHLLYHMEMGMFRTIVVMKNRP